MQEGIAMDVAVIVPCYRQAHFLPTTLKSIAGQTYSKIQTIVVDDGSDDDVQSVVSQFVNVKYLRKANGGLSSARNYGIDNCSPADVFIFLDSDDLLRSRSIEMLVTSLNLHPDAEMSQIDFEYFYDSVQSDAKSTVSDIFSFHDNMELTELIIQRNLGPVHTIAYRSTLFDRLRYDENLKSCEDWDINARFVLNGGKLVRCNYNGALYRVHPNSMSTNIPRMLSCRITVLRKVIRSLTETERIGSYQATIISVVRRLLRRAWYHHDSSLTEEIVLLLKQCRDSGVINRHDEWEIKASSYVLRIFDSLCRPGLAKRYKSEIL
jgi:glycosyltransferase involved in cell wall biosynthesis